MKSEGQIHDIRKEAPYFLFFLVKLFKSPGILFIMKLYAWFSIFTKIKCIYTRQLLLKEV